MADSSFENLEAGKQENDVFKVLKEKVRMSAKNSRSNKITLPPKLRQNEDNTDLKKKEKKTERLLLEYFLQQIIEEEFQAKRLYITSDNSNPQKGIEKH